MVSVQKSSVTLTLEITEFLDFAYYLVFQKKRRFQNLEPFPDERVGSQLLRCVCREALFATNHRSSDERLAASNAPNLASGSHLCKDINRSHF
jgi:hypothetical protein